MKVSTLCIVALLSLALAAPVCAQSSVDSYRKAGAAYFKAGQFRESVRAYQQVIRLTPNDADAYRHLGEAYSRLGMNKEAAEAYEKQADSLLGGNTPAAPAASPRTANGAMPLEEIARRMIRKESQVDCLLPGIRGGAGIGEPTSPVCARDKVPTRVTFVSVRVNALKDGKYPVYAKFTVRGYYRDSTLVNDRDQRFLLSKDSGTWMVEPDTGTYTPTRHEEVSAPPAPEPTDVPDTSAAAAQADRVRPAAANRGGGAVPLGQYVCVTSAGGQLIHVGGFTLQAGGVYHDEDNGRGTFTYDANQHQIAFQGAAMGGQVGRYAGGTFTLKSARNSVDCDRGN